MNTVIQWLIEKLDNNLDIKHSWRTRQYIDQAKEMENEIINRLKQRIDDLENQILEINERN